MLSEPQIANRVLGCCGPRRSEAMDLQLGPLVQAIESDAVLPDELVDTFEAAYCSWWSSAVIDKDEVLGTFSSPEHEATIQSFRELDSRFPGEEARHIGWQG